MDETFSSIDISHWDLIFQGEQQVKPSTVEIRWPSVSYIPLFRWKSLFLFRYRSFYLYIFWSVPLSQNGCLRYVFRSVRADRSPEWTRKCSQSWAYKPWHLSGGSCRRRHRSRLTTWNATASYVTKLPLIVNFCKLKLYTLSVVLNVFFWWYGSRWVDDLFLESKIFRQSARF